MRRRFITKNDTFAVSGSCRDKGIEFDGILVNGLPSGHGTLKWTDGTIYNGYFFRGTPIGEGEFEYADGTSMSGVWEGDTFVSDKAFKANEEDCETIDID